MPVYNSDKLYKYLKELQIIDIEKLNESYSESKNQNKLIGEILLSKDLVSDETLGKIIADLIGYPFVKLTEKYINQEVLNLVPENYARAQKVVVFEHNNDEVYAAMMDPANLQTREFLRKKTGRKVLPFFATQRDIARSYSLYSKDVKKAFDVLLKEGISEAKNKVDDEPPIVKIVQALLENAYQNNASDVHIEGTQDASIVRFRIDGILHDIISFPKDIYERIVGRIKVMAGLRTDEHQKAQDGKIVMNIDEEDLDVRVSIVPVIEGEKIVLRLLSERARSFSLLDLGLSEEDIQKVQNAYQKPHGMILATGPTGSGKTTSLYAVLKVLNREGVNIMTIEDPVEYDIERINQIQPNEKGGLTFAKGLRSIVRQDPDIILVGEIRDNETADIAINAAMTGHLVLSTLHTNDAATTIPRLYDMQIEPYLIASTVNVIIAQRLVRKICSPCRVSEEVGIDSLKDNISKELTEKYFSGEKFRLYKGKGCKICNMTGYSGRIGIYEVMVVDEDIRKAIGDKMSVVDINKLAINHGMTTMLEDGIRKAQGGITTMDEVLRVTME